MKRLFKSLIDNSWLTEQDVDTLLKDENLVKAIEESTSPSYNNIFNALNMVSYNDVKVLILGQDPYPNPLHAHGLAFSSKNKTTPGSLRNIFKAIDSVYHSDLVSAKNNDLTNWAKNGVLLLNTALTYKNTFNSSITEKENKNNQVREKKFHMKTWATFIDMIVTK